MSTFAQSVNDASPPLLLIDDDLSLSRLIRDYCETDGLTVTSAGTGEEGIYLSQHNRFQLVILDVMLPGINGFEVLNAHPATLECSCADADDAGSCAGPHFRGCKAARTTISQNPLSRRN